MERNFLNATESPGYLSHVFTQSSFETLAKINKKSEYSLMFTKLQKIHNENKRSEERDSSLTTNDVNLP